MEQIIKKCKRCGEVKNLTEFYKHKVEKDGFRSDCKKCINKRNKKLYWNNPEKARKGWREYRQNNLEKARETQKKYYQNNKEKIKKYRNGLKELIKEYNRKYRELNKNDINKKRKEYWAKRQQIDIQYRIKKSIRSIINQRIKRKFISKNGKPTFSFLPYTVDDLIKHLEFLFQPWMNWQNYGNKEGCWVIDHRRPDSSFHYTSVEDEEFQKCWALENLQPMEYIENIKKGNKYL